jgi:hypothetical protein
MHLLFSKWVVMRMIRLAGSARVMAEIKNGVLRTQLRRVLGLGG